MQVGHALDAQFREKEPDWSEIPSLRKLVNARTSKGLISDMYGCINKMEREGEVEPKNRIKWERDVGPIMEQQLTFVLALGPRVSLSPSQIVFHLYLNYRSYYTPLKLFMFEKRSDAECQRCGDRRGDLVHMVWRCPRLYRYWKGITDKINSVFGTSLDTELIAWKWQAKDPPMVVEWVKEVNDTIDKEKYIYKKRGNDKKFQKMWKRNNSVSECWM